MNEQAGETPEWCLLNFVRTGDAPPEGEDAKPNVHMTAIRSMTTDEVDQTRVANRAVTSLRSASQVRPFEQATNEALQVVEDLLSLGTRIGDDPEHQVLPNLAMDQWLSQAAMMKDRMVRDANRCLGSDAKRWLRSALRDLYERNADWRMILEWRNASQHRLPPLHLTTLHVDVEAGKDAWTMDPGAIESDRQGGGKWPSFVLDRVEEHPDLREVMESGWKTVANLYGGFLLAHEDKIMTSVNHMLSLLAEAQTEHPGGRIVANMSAMRINAEDDHFHWGAWLPIRHHAIQAMVEDIETARARLSRVTSGGQSSA